MSDDNGQSGGWSWLSWTVVGVGVALVVFVAGPRLAHWQAQRSAARNACISNLRLLDGAKEQFAVEHQLATGTPVAWTNLLGPKGYIQQLPVCLAGGTYTLHLLGEEPTCSIQDHDLPP